MKHIHLCVWTIAVLHLALFGDSTEAQNPQDRLQRKIIVGTELDYPPYSFLNTANSSDGFNVELIRAIAAEMGLDVEIEIGPWNHIRQSLESGRIDAVVGMFYSAERDSLVDFTAPFTYIGYSAFSPKGTPRLKEKTGLTDMRIIVMKDDIMHDYVRRHEFTDSIVPTATVREGLQLLARGRGDFALMPKLPGEYWKSEMRLDRVLQSGIVLEREPYCVGVREGDTELASILGEGLAVLQSNGELRRISDKWLGVLEDGIRVRTFYFVIGGILFFALTASLVLALWFYTLKNQVRFRTAELRKEIQQRIEAEKAAREGEDRFRRLFEHSNDAIFIHTQDGKFLEVNDRACRMTGYSREELCTMPLLELHPPEDHWLGGLGLKETIEKGNARFEIRLKRKNGHLIDTEISARLVDSKLGLIQGVVRDVTERRKQETLLRQNEERFRLYVSHSPTAIFLADANGRYTFANPAACVLTGFSYEEILRQSVDSLTPSDSREQTAEAFAKLIREGKVEAEIALKTREGGKVDVLIQAASLPPNQYIGFCTDITLRKQTEESMKSAKEAAEDANRAKSEFLANMSHEIRTPMNGIIGMTELALTTTNTDQRREYLKTVQTSAQSLLEIINEILDFSKIEAGKVKLSLAPFDIRELTESVTNLLSEKAREKGIVVIKKISVEPIPLLCGDALRIRQILTNLLGNAIKFTDKGRVTVVLTARTAGVSDDRRCIDLEVHDTGIGIPETVLKDIFDSFNQGKTNYLRSQGGTGLGLTISKRLTELMGGDLRVESKVGKGSLFCVTLELKVYDSPTDGKPPSEPPAKPHLAQFRGRILVAEDNPVNIKVAEIMFKQHGVEPTFVTNGEDAVTRVFSENYDLVFMDIQMPKLDGYAATRSIRDGGSGDIPVVAMTAYAMQEDRRAAMDAGMNDYITKPINREDIVRILEKYLGPGRA